MSSANGGAGNVPTSFEVLSEVALDHLPNDARFVVQRQRGGSVPEDAVQFYLAWNWQGLNGSGRTWKGGGSVQAGQIPAMIDALARAYEAATGEKLPGCGGVGGGGKGGRPAEPEIGQSGTFADMCAGEEGG